MTLQKIFFIFICGIFSADSSLWSMSRLSQQSLALVRPQSIQSISTVLTTPQAKINPTLIQEIAKSPAQTFPTPFIQQTLQSSPFKQTRPNLMKKTTSLLLSRSEALKILNLSENPTLKEIKIAYKAAALKAHPDQGGTNKEMQQINKAYQLLINEPRPESESSSKTNHSIDDLSMAIINKDIDKIARLIKSPNMLSEKNYEGNTALHLLCEMNNPQLVQIALESGANVHAQNNQKQTPLMIACSNYKNGKIIKMLLDAGARADAVDGVSNTALQYLIKKISWLNLISQQLKKEYAYKEDIFEDLEETIDNLVKFGADVNFYKEAPSFKILSTVYTRVSLDSPLDLAIKYDLQKVAKILRKHNAYSRNHPIKDSFARIKFW